MDTIELRIHESHIVRLKSLGTAGYQWSATVGNPEVVQVERVKVVRDASETIMPGHSLDEQFMLNALAVGETIVHFIQARGFETEQAAHATYDILVHVTPG